LAAKLLKAYTPQKKLKSKRLIEKSPTIFKICWKVLGVNNYVRKKVVHLLTF